ncbi:MAG: tetratricopeptide repeat protein [Steroidobacteraceae bacterium]
MRKVIAGSAAVAALAFAISGTPAPAAGSEPTVHQIYEAATSGRLDQAQEMMNQVLRDHPESAKAHFVQAELYVREGNAGLARSELLRAEQLKPGLPDESPQAVQALKAELGLRTVPSAPHFPWGTLLILALAVGVVWMLFRRRNSYVQYPAGVVPAGGAPGAYGPGGFVGPGGTGSGIGGSIAGGLASGLAVGAGVVAGEELAHHFLDGRHEPGVLPPPAGDDSNRGNSDMGGTDFGVNDPGSWDDGGGGDGGGGGGDWS